MAAYKLSYHYHNHRRHYYYLPGHAKVHQTCLS